MKISNRQYAKLLFELTDEVDEKKLKSNIEGFMTLVTRRGDRNRIRDIIRSYDGVYAEAKGASACQITSAFPLDKAIRDDVQKIIGQDVSIEEEVDKELIGGMKIRIDDKIIDGSARKHIEDIKLKITQ